MWCMTVFPIPAYFNPRSPWGERPLVDSHIILLALFQSTLPVGGATIFIVISLRASPFQSTLPVGGATPIVCPFRQRVVISIHAPREGSDESLHRSSHPHPDFNPRSPWGERPEKNSVKRRKQLISIHAPRGGSDCFADTDAESFREFQSTLPVGGATHILNLVMLSYVFQSTLPVGGATHSADLPCPG